MPQKRHVTPRQRCFLRVSRETMRRNEAKPPQTRLTTANTMFHVKQWCEVYKNAFVWPRETRFCVSRGTILVFFYYIIDTLNCQWKECKLFMFFVCFTWNNRKNDGAVEKSGFCCFFAWWKLFASDVSRETIQRKRYKRETKQALFFCMAKKHFRTVFHVKQ